MTRTFAGYVIGLAKQNVRQARSVALYIGKRTDTKTQIMERVDAALKAGKIDAEWREQLKKYLDLLHGGYTDGGKLLDDRPSREWEELGNGARRKKAIKDSELL